MDFSLPSRNHPFSEKLLSLSLFLLQSSYWQSPSETKSSSKNFCCISFCWPLSDCQSQNPQMMGQTLKFHGTPTTQSLKIMAAVWGCFLLALNTCARCLWHCNSHTCYWIQTDFGYWWGTSAEASMENQSPLGLITVSYNNQSWKGF